MGKRRPEETAKRKAIPFFTNWLQMTMRLPDKNIGELMRLCFEYTQTGIRPPDLDKADIAVQMCFESFEVSEKQNYVEWQESCRQRRINRNKTTILKLHKDGLSKDDIIALHPEWIDIISDIL